MSTKENLNVGRDSIASGDLISRLAKILRDANGFIATKLHEKGIDGLAPSHGDILKYLFTNGSATMQGLATAINRDPSTVTTLVKKLVDLGYVRTERSNVDRRSTYVALTEKGEGLRDDFEDISAELISIQMKGIDKSRFNTACEILDAIGDNFEEYANDNDQ